MNFFDYIKNESFFKPLTFKYRRIYYDCIRILIDRSKELPVLYESDAKDSITLYLKNEEIQRLIEEASDENEAVQLQACLLYTSPSPRDGLLSRMPSSA